MNSSISSSETDLEWRGWMRTFAVLLAGGSAMLYVAVLTLDPFCTGRFSLLDGIDITISAKASSNAGRVRDPRFDVAILGNSHARFEPARLDELTGRRFVLVNVAGAGPEEQIAIARAFVRHHAERPIGLLWVLDTYWCEADESATPHYPDFPFWLYESSDLKYLASIFSTDAVQAMLHRIAIRLLGAPPAGRADGWTTTGHDMPREAIVRAITASRPAAASSDSRFPSAHRLQAFLSELDPRIELTIIFAPTYISSIPEPGTPADQRLQDCKQRFRAMTELRPRSAFADYMRDDDIARDAANFLDSTHARDAIFQLLEPDIAQMLKTEMQEAYVPPLASQTARRD